MGVWEGTITIGGYPFDVLVRCRRPSPTEFSEWYGSGSINKIIKTNDLELGKPYETEIGTILITGPVERDMGNIVTCIEFRGTGPLPKVDWR